MDKKILFISEGATFIVNAIVDALRTEEFTVIQSKPEIGEVSHIDKKPDILFYYVDEKAASNTEFNVYLRDLCIGEDKTLFLVGYADELASVGDMLPPDRIGDVFERPINAKEIADRLNKKVSGDGFGNKKKLILVVDDSGTMLRTVKDWLEPKYSVALANSAANGITYLASNIPDLILLDYEMPICSGPQMLQMIRSEIRTEQIPVIFLTSKNDKESVSSVLALKPQGYLLKTMEPSKVIETIDNFFLNQKAKESMKN